MKKLFLLLVPALLISCGGVDKYNAPIEELANMWSETTTKVTDFAEMMNSTISNSNEQMAPMVMPEADIDALGSEMSTKWRDARANVMTAVSAFGPIQNELSGFMASWGEKSNELKALTDGLAAGSLEGDIMGQIGGLKEMATDANDKLGNWQTTFDSAKGNLDGSLGTLSELYKSIKGE